MSSAGSTLHEEHLIVPFDSTTDALALQACAQRYGLFGRLIPIPRTLSAGCGMAWKEPVAHRSLLEATLAAENLEHGSIVQMRLR